MNLTVNTGERCPPESRVDLAIDMSSAVHTIMMDNLRDQNPGISKEKLLQKARARMYGAGRKH